MSIDTLLSLQLYSLRDEADLGRQLDIARDAGFAQVETFGPYYADAAQTRDLLDARDLRAPSGHFPLDAVTSGLEATMETARTLGIGDIVMPAVPEVQRQMDAAGWREVGSRLGDAARRAADAGFSLSYHNHHWELREEDGRSMLDHLFSAAGDAPLGWQADIAWLVRGGGDPYAILQRHGARLRSAHVKDLAPEGTHEDEDGWADVGYGTMDWPALWKAARDMGAKLMVAEHDKPSDGARFARRSFETLKDYPA